MDTDNELARAKWLLIAVCAFLFSLCMVTSEVSLLVKGRDAVAMIEKVYESTGGRRRSQPRLSVDYQFVEPDGTLRRANYDYPIDWEPPANGKLPVRYTPGKDGLARPAGKVGWLWITIFFGSLGSILVAGIILWREGQQAARELGPKRR